MFAEFAYCILISSDKYNTAASVSELPSGGDLLF